MKKAWMMLAMVATTSLWAYGFQVGNLYYNIVDDNEFTVQVAKVSDFWDNPYEDLTSVNIPATVNMYGVTYTVVGIEGGAFRNCRNLKHITLPNTIEHIGSFAFTNSGIYENNEYWTNGVMYLNKVLVAVKPFVAGKIVIRDGTKGIGGSAFENCSKITSIVIPNSVRTIADRAFYRCSSLTSITIPSSVKRIDNKAFFGCSSLTSITIPEGVTSLENDVFRLCSSLTSIVIPEGVTRIGEEAFYGCSSLKSITIPESVTSIYYQAFYGCSSLTSVTVHSNIKSFSSTFGSQVTEYILGPSITSIGEEAFSNCTGLQKLNYTGTKKQWESVTKNTHWKVGSSIKTIVCSDKKVKAK